MKHKLWFWLCLALLLLAGCAPGPSPVASSEAPPEIPPGPGAAGAASGPGPMVEVRADWSRLEGERPGPHPDVDGGRWYPELTDSLIPGADYGPLVPYLGSFVYPFSRWESETGETQVYWNSWPHPLYGLMTREGRIVVDPVYQDAIPYSYLWQGEDLALPVLILSRSGPDWTETGGTRYAVAAEDGSWTTGFEFLNYTNRDDQLLLVSPRGLARLDSASGARTDWAWEELGVKEGDVSETLEVIQWLFGLTWTDHGVAIGLVQEGAGSSIESSRIRVFQPEAGEVFLAEYRQWDEWHSEHFDRRIGRRWEVVQEGGRVTISRGGETYVVPDAPPNCWSAEVRNELVILNADSCYQLRRLPDGELLLEGAYIQFLSDAAHPERLGCVSVYNDTYTNCTVYDAGLAPILSLPQSGENSRRLSFRLRDGLLSCYDESTWFGCWDLDAGRYAFYRNLYAGD